MVAACTGVAVEKPNESKTCNVASESGGCKARNWTVPFTAAILDGVAGAWPNPLYHIPLRQLFATILLLCSEGSILQKNPSSAVCSIMSSCSLERPISASSFHVQRNSQNLGTSLSTVLPKLQRLRSFLNSEMNFNITECPIAKRSWRLQSTWPCTASPACNCTNIERRAAQGSDPAS